MRIKESLSKEKFEKYLRFYDTIKIIPLKNEEPIFILKVGASDCKKERCEIIHKDKLIKTNKWGVYYYPHPINLLSKRKINEAKYREYGADVRYLDGFKSLCLPKEFLIKNILDDRIKINDSVYIKPIKDFFRKYGVLQEKRGKVKKISKVSRDRDNLIIESYQDIIKKTKKRKPLPILSIYKKLTNCEVSFATIRRVLNNYNKK